MVFRKHKQKSDSQKRIAAERIAVLFNQADEQFKNDPKLSNRYVELARKIAMKYKVRIPGELKRRFCKHCHSYLKQGVNCRVRVDKKQVVYCCLECKGLMRIPYKK